MNDRDLNFLRRAIELSFEARRKGNRPFGAVLVDANGRVLLEAENTVNTERDCTGHAEAKALRQASQQYPLDVLEASTLYASCEPCAMCAGAIFWSRIRRVVFALPSTRVGELAKGRDDSLRIRCEEVLSRGSRTTLVEGPVAELEDEAAEAFAGFWDE